MELDTPGMTDPTHARTGQALSAEVLRSRTQRDAQAALIWPVVQPRIDAHLTACSIASEALRRRHQGIVEALPFDVGGSTREASTWQMAGRCIGLLDVLLIEVRAGVTDLTVPTSRALHEATSLLVVLHDPQAEDLRATWLQDEGRLNYVKPGQARSSVSAFEQRVSEARVRLGLPAAVGTGEQRAALYDRLSRGAHHRRSSLLNAVSVPTRSMAYGVDDDPLRAATAATWSASLTTSVLLTCAATLGGFFEPTTTLTVELKPLIDAIEAIRRDQPLDESTV